MLLSPGVLSGHHSAVSLHRDDVIFECKGSFNKQLTKFDHLLNEILLE